MGRPRLRLESAVKKSVGRAVLAPHLKNDSTIPKHRWVTMHEDLDIKDKVREHYAGVAKGESDCCARDTSCGCGISEQIGYSKEELVSVPKDAEMGLGCGTPVSLADLRPGETVVDLGSGGGIDCFLAAKAVGPNGKVI